MTSPHRTAVAFGIVALVFAACGGSQLNPGTGSGGAAGTDAVGTGGTTGEGGTIGTAGTTGTAGVGGGCPAVRVSPADAVPSEHRATATACQPSAAPPTDAGPMSCTTDADCASDGGAYNYYNVCLHGVCSFDQCLTDADCGSSGVCGCSSDYYGGNAQFHPNICVPANCRVDADCGAGGYCSPSRGRCGTFDGYYCHKASDSCVDPTVDCAGCPATGCVYAPTVSAFVCGLAVCGG